MIGFYGGEPLLNFSLIRNIVEYCETMKHKIHFGYTITINAVILDKYADYLVKNNFLIVISLDGNERNHSYRIDRDGINSFNSVISNVDLLRNKYPDYFDKNVTFNAVLHDRNMVEEINNYIFQRYGKNPSINELVETGIRNDKKNILRKSLKVSKIIYAIGKMLTR